LGQAPPGRDEAREKASIDADGETRAVARVLDRAAPMFHATEPTQRELDQVVRGAFQVGDRPDTTPATTWMVSESLVDPSPLHSCSTAGTHVVFNGKLRGALTA